jgi:hypothetical protein
MLCLKSTMITATLHSQLFTLEETPGAMLELQKLLLCCIRMA